MPCLSCIAYPVIISLSRPLPSRFQSVPDEIQPLFYDLFTFGRVFRSGCLRDQAGEGRGHHADEEGHVDVPYRALPDSVPHEVLQEEEVVYALFVGACRDERGLGELLHELLLHLIWVI